MRKLLGETVRDPAITKQRLFKGIICNKPAVEPVKRQVRMRRKQREEIKECVGLI